MLIIEKEGIAEQLALFADQKGIALLNTRGFLTEYAEVLSKKSEKEGCNIAILTDFDVSGLILATKVPGAYRIGVDFETLNDLGLDIEDVEEKYKPGNHLKPLQEGGELADVYPEDWVDYVEDRRVEINSVVTELDDNAKFWEWIVQKLRDRFDTRNYNRAVDVPKYVMPKCLESLNEEIKKKGIAILKRPREKLQERLSDIGPMLSEVINLSNVSGSIVVFSNSNIRFEYHFAITDERVLGQLHCYKEVGFDELTMI